jgi:hypothetical protein
MKGGGGGGCEPIMIPNTAYSTYLFIFYSRQIFFNDSEKRGISVSVAKKKPRF